MCAEVRRCPCWNARLLIPSTPTNNHRGPILPTCSKLVDGSHSQRARANHVTTIFQHNRMVLMLTSSAESWRLWIKWLYCLRLAGDFIDLSYGVMPYVLSEALLNNMGIYASGMAFLSVISNYAIYCEKKSTTLRKKRSVSKKKY